ncbi:MAG: RNA polymerase sigma factor [Terracidiphilus sp.]
MQSSQSRQIATATRHNAHQQDFALAVEDHRPQIFRFLLASSRDVDTAEALTQECFLKAFRSWSNFRGDSSVATWLIRIAINLQRDHWRNRRLQFWRQVHRNAVDPTELSDYVSGTDASAEERAIARDQVRQIWSIVNGINEPQRVVFLLRYVEEMNLSEIADATGLSIGTVKSHISRTLAKVRAALKPAQANVLTARL